MGIGRSRKAPNTAEVPSLFPACLLSTPPQQTDRTSPFPHCQRGDDHALANSAIKTAVPRATSPARPRRKPPLTIRPFEEFQMGDLIFWGFLICALAMFLFFPDHFKKVNQNGYENIERTKNMLKPAAKAGFSLFNILRKRL
jgi:hypothetical protein